MTEINRPLKVFLYHAPADKIAGRDLYLRLIQEGVDARVVKEKLLPGQDWKHELHNAFREADVVIIGISGRFNREEFRHRQVRLALDAVVDELQEEGFIIPVRLEECLLPQTLQKWQCVDLFKKVGYERLLYALHLQAEKIGAAIESKDGSLPQVDDHEEPIADEKTGRTIQGEPRIVEGAGILIDGTVVKQYAPGRATLLALLGFGLIAMMMLFGPAWIEESAPATSTPTLKPTRTSAPPRGVTPDLSFQLRPMPTLVGQGEVSHIVFLVDTSGSMQGQTIRMAKSALSRFMARLEGDLLISIIEFDTNVELRAASSPDRPAAIEAIQSTAVEASHDGSCVWNAFYAGMQQAMLTPAGQDNGSLIILLTDVAPGDNVGWNCSIRLMDDFLKLTGNLLVPMFSMRKIQPRLEPIRPAPALMAPSIWRATSRNGWRTG
jgi:hypothetical protein